MKCPTDNNKQYIIPTKKWLKPIEPFILDEINTSGLLMVANFLEKEKIIVKITNGKRNDIIAINEYIKNMPNFIETFCSFSCLEDFDVIDSKYENKNKFCNAKENSGDFITLELMKKYKNGSLNKYINKFNLDQVINIIKQLLLAQVYIFNKIGFLHNDIHLSNILIDIFKEPIKLKYKFELGKYKIIDNKKIIISSNFIPIIYDFDKSTIYKNENISYDIYTEQKTLAENIYRTFIECINLIKDKSIKDQINKKLEEEYENIRKYNNISKKNLRSFYKKYYDYDYYIKEETRYMLTFSILLLRLLDENTANDWYD